MLHELRFYEIAAGHLDDYINHAGKVAVPFRGDDYGKLLGFWACEIGAMNCVFNLWEHESVATREVLRAKLAQQDVWRNDYLPHSQPLMRRQFSRLLTPLAGRSSLERTLATALGELPDARVVVTTDDGSAGERGRVGDRQRQERKVDLRASLVDDGACQPLVSTARGDQVDLEP